MRHPHGQGVSFLEKTAPGTENGSCLHQFKFSHCTNTPGEAADGPRAWASEPKRKTRKKLFVSVAALPSPGQEELGPSKKRRKDVCTWRRQTR